MGFYSQQHGIDNYICKNNHNNNDNDRNVELT